MWLVYWVFATRQVPGRSLSSDIVANQFEGKLGSELVERITVREKRD